MGTMTSIWRTGTYEVLISKDPEGQPGDLMVVVFASPADPEDAAADEDAPILAHIDVSRDEYDRDLEAYQYGLHTIGERGLVRPESVEPIYGPKLALRILLALYQGADRDFRGVDMDDRPWREPSEEGAFPLMTQIHPLLMDLRERLND